MKSKKAGRARNLKLLDSTWEKAKALMEAMDAGSNSELVQVLIREEYERRKGPTRISCASGVEDAAATELAKNALDHSSSPESQRNKPKGKK